MSTRYQVEYYHTNDPDCLEDCSDYLDSYKEALSEAKENIDSKGDQPTLYAVITETINVSRVDVITKQRFEVKKL